MDFLPVHPLVLGAIALVGLTAMAIVSYFLLVKPIVSAKPQVHHCCYSHPCSSFERGLHALQASAEEDLSDEEYSDEEYEEGEEGEFKEEDALALPNMSRRAFNKAKKKRERAERREALRHFAAEKEEKLKKELEVSDAKSCDLPRETQ